MNEKLFFKVFKNKYILQNIFKQIENTECVNRIKFKDIVSMGWMVKNKQYSLLKCKLYNGENILIDKESIKLLFIHLSDNKHGSSDNDCSVSILIMNEILIHLLTNKRNEIEMYDLTKLAIKYNNIKLFNLFISEPYSIIVYPSTFKYALTNCDIHKVKHLLSHFESFYNCNDPKISNQLNESSLVYASRNNNHSQEIIKFILDSNLYCTIPTPIDQSSLSILSKQKTRIEYNDYLRLDCIEIKMKLFQLNLLVGYKFINDDFTNEDSTFEEISLKYKISIFNLKYSLDQREINRWDKINNGCQEINEDSKINQFGKIKLLRKLIVRDISYRWNFYKYYILKYKESINELNGIDKLISKNDDKEDSNFISLYRYIGQNQSDTSEDHFGKLCFQSLSLPLDKRIKWFDIFNYIKNDFVIVTDTLVADWLVGNYEKDQILYIYVSMIVNCFEIEFSTLELLQYTIKLDMEINGQYGLFNRYPNYILLFFKKSVKECDLKALDFINQVFNRNDIEMEDDKLQNYCNIKFELPSNTNDINKLLEHLLNCNYLETDIFLNLLSKFSYVQDIEYILESINSQINFNYHKISNIKREFIYSIINDTLQETILLLNLIGDFKLLNINKDFYISNRIKEVFIYYNFEFNQVLSIIDKLISIYDNGLVDLESLGTLLNHFYEKSLSIKGISFNQVNKIIEKVEKLVLVNHQFYHSFLFFNIKSNNLSKYILSLPDIFKTLNSDVVKYKLSNYIDHSIFSMDYIQISNCDDIILEIINQLFKKSNNIPNNIKTQFINYNINHCLEIRNWGFLNKLLDNPNNNFHCDETDSKYFILKPITYGLKIDLVEKLLVYNLELLDQILNQSIWYCRFDIIEYLLSNYTIGSIDLNILFSTNIDNISYITSPSILYQLFSTIIKNQKQDQHLVQNLFENSFLIGNFNMCDLLLLFFQDQITLSNSIISTNISNNQIHILNYYKDKNILFTNDNLIYFKTQLILKNKC